MRITIGNGAPVEVHHHDPKNAAHVQRLELRGGTVDNGLHKIPLDPIVNHTTEFVNLTGEGTAREILANVLASLPLHSDGSPLWVVVEDDHTARGQLLQALFANEWDLPNPSGPTALITNGGFDYASAQFGGAASATNIAVNIALTADSTAPASTDTTLTSEYNHTSAGLNRKAATYAHTVGASTYTLSATWTANGSDVLPFTANKMGVFSQLSGGTLTTETLVSPAITWNASADTGTIVETFTV